MWMTEEEQGMFRRARNAAFTIAVAVVVTLGVMKLLERGCEYVITVEAVESSR